MITAFTVLFGVLLGAATGSFIACAAYRLPRKISMNGRSMCPHCDAPIGWKNIPVLGWLLLRGRSACCNQQIAAKYLLVESVAAAAGGTTAWILGPFIPYGLVIVLIATVIIVDKINRAGPASTP